MGRISFGEEVESLIRRTDPGAAFLGEICVEGAINEEITGFEERPYSWRSVSLEILERIASVDDDAEASFAEKTTERRSWPGLRKGLAAEEGQALEVITIDDCFYNMINIFESAASFGPHLLITTLRAADRTPLKPEGGSPARALRLSAEDHLGHS